MTAFLAILGAAVSLVMTSVAGAWQLLLGVGAGTGAVYLLRWYWWRINAWSEVSAMTAAAITTVLLHTVIHIQGTEAIVFAKSILLTVAVTTVVWLAVTYLTRAGTRIQTSSVLPARQARSGRLEANCCAWRPKSRPAVMAGIISWTGCSDA